MNISWKVLIGIIAVWFVTTLVISDGRRYCSDGSTTSSSGSGTCSWHGGQGSQPAKTIANYVLLGALGVWAYVSFFRRARGEKLGPPKPLPAPPQEVLTPRTRLPLTPSPKSPTSLPQQHRPMGERPQPIPADTLPPPLCQMCGEIMRLRLARRGRNRGTYFWGCSRYPSCTGTIDCAERKDLRHHS